ncbi:MAG: hypothetical protein HGA47_03070, partial [Zoogloea sp.]|nr:hypothetical protein [Zoogloea sp.]
HHLTVSFGPEREYEFRLSATDTAGLDQEAARAWLFHEFEVLECTPGNPMGKVLLLDALLNVAKYGGEARFAAAGEWARHYAAAVSVALDRPAIRVDVPGFTVG